MLAFMPNSGYANMRVSLKWLTSLCMEVGKGSGKDLHCVNFYSTPQMPSEFKEETFFSEDKRKDTNNTQVI